MNWKKLLQNTASLALFGIIFSKLIGYIYRIILSRLGPQEYGTFILALSIISFTLIIAKLGLDSAIMKFLPLFKVKKQYSSIKSLLSNSYLITTISSMLLFLIIILISNPLSHLFNNPALRQALIIMSPVIPIAALSFMTLSTLKALNLEKQAVFSQYILERFSLILITILLFYFSFSLDSAIYAYTLASFTTLIISSMFLLNPARKVLGNKSKYANFSQRDLLSYSMPLMFAGLTYLIIRYIDTILVGFYLNAESVGFYDIATLGALTLLIIPEAIMYLFIPKLSELHASNKKREFNDLIRKTKLQIMMFNFIVFIILFLGGKMLINIFLDSSYLPSAVPLAILSIGIFIRTLYLPETSTLAVLKKTKLIFGIDLASAMANIILCLIIIPRFGLLGASISTSLTYILIAALTSYFSKRFLK